MNSGRVKLGFPLHYQFLLYVFCLEEHVGLRHLDKNVFKKVEITTNHKENNKLTVCTIALEIGSKHLA